ncbi:hypothetical protein AVEN_240679-1 [Araneus ventricosus]|uniref:Helitron helicase-like domain-containing protein n=1 Tax=Araneus ventricosus TaxID=182803 RepID=A0A4Y2D7K0_ARAVE|nr:hypothetical protein AVEN_240679-1 [Araneus ventricosus]
MGAKLVDFNGRGPYMFKVHGQIFHRTSHLQPFDGEAPQYAPLYAIDSTQAAEQHLRTELYKGLADHLQNAEANTGVKGGIPDILPLSFEGPPRNRRERCADAMSIFAKYGPPDIFIIFTANSK